MTDNEIIKSLECLMHDNCEDCHYYRDDCADRIKDPIELSKYALALVDRLQEENERLKINLKAVLYERADHTEAIKEFAERLKEKARTVSVDEMYDGQQMYVSVETIENLVKEMVGENYV